MGCRVPAFLLAASGLAGSLAAQQPANTYVVAAYYRCDVTREARADSIYRTIAVPILQKHQAAGSLTGFGFNAHRQGGAWRRLEFLTGTDLTTLFRVQALFGQEFDQAHPTREFDAICGSHDDYIWEQALAGPATATPVVPPTAGSTEGSLSMSTYYECDIAREADADSIFGQRLVPILDRHVGLGHLTSWSWLRHSIGGTFRRLLVLRAPDLGSLLQGRAAVIADAQRDPAVRPFNSVCNRHVDYIWRVVAGG